MNPTKKILLFIFVQIMMITLTACGGKPRSSDNVYPNIDNADIPDVLEKTVGTLANTYFSSGITDNKDYQSVLMVTFENTTEADYNELMEHYRSASTGTDEEGFLLFEWGRLQAVSAEDSISVTAYIK